MTIELTPDQRDRMHAVILAELRELRAQAVAAGVDRAFDTAIEHRLRVLASRR